MKLSQMALSNIKHNIKNYAMYFFAMCFSVFTTYSFLALALSNNVNNKIMESASYSMTFKAFSILILVFVLFFLISSNNSFIRARKKEISTYALFGMENSRIGRLLFLETLMLGGAAIIVGVVSGVFFSKLTTMVLLKMTMSAYKGDIAFNISVSSIIYTTLVFLGIFCVMGLTGRRVITRFKLVDLFKGSKLSEGKSKGSYILLIISIALIVLGYTWALSHDYKEIMSRMLLIMGIVIAGTYIFFWGGFQKVLHLLKLNKKVFYKDANLVSTSLLSHRIKTMSTTMATIAVLVAISTTAISFGYSLFTTAEKSTYIENHYDLHFYTDDVTLKDQVKDVIQENGSFIIEEITIDRNVMRPKPINFPSKYDGYFEKDHNNMGVYAESTFNKMVDMSKYSGEHISVAKGDATLIFFREGVDWTGAKLGFSDRELKVTAIEGGDYSFGRMLITVLDDEDYDALVASGEISNNVGGSDYWPLTAINYKDALKNDKLASDINEVLEGKTGSKRITYFTLNEFLSIYGMICFIGFFMCAVFILMTASMLYFKQVTIATEEKSQYKMLKKIGLDSDMENKIIRKRLFPIFFIPLFIGIIHSVFAMKAADTIIFSKMLPDPNSFIGVLKTSAVMYLVYSVVYIVFYFITKGQYKRIIK